MCLYIESLEFFRRKLFLYLHTLFFYFLFCHFIKFVHFLYFLYNFLSYTKCLNKKKRNSISFYLFFSKNIIFGKAAIAKQFHVCISRSGSTGPERIVAAQYIIYYSFFFCVCEKKSPFVCRFYSVRLKIKWLQYGFLFIWSFMKGLTANRGKIFFHTLTWTYKLMYTWFIDGRIIICSENFVFFFWTHIKKLLETRKSRKSGERPLEILLIHV